MLARAHILVNVESGKTKEVYERLANMEGVQHVDAISGPYDLLATVQGADFNVIGNLVINEIQKVNGVTGTITCNVITFKP